MILLLSPGELATYVCRQLDAFVPTNPTTPAELLPDVGTALERIEHCFRHVRMKYFYERGMARFDPLHTDQYAMFLYTLANALWRRGGDPRQAARLYALNKALHAVDILYELALPDIWCLQHPVGTVLGRAKYGEYFACYQGCLVGVGLSGRAPVLGRGVVLFGGAAVVGGCTLGDNVWVSTGAQVFEEDIPRDSLVIGRSPQLDVRCSIKRVQQDFFELLPPTGDAP